MPTLKVVTKRNTSDAPVYDFRCPYPVGCGDVNGDPESRFMSTNWPTAELAAERGQQHIDEHETGEPMPDLNAFRSAKGLIDENAGQPVQPDDWSF